MPVPLAILGLAIAGKATLTSWAVVRWRERPLARIRRAVANMSPCDVALLRPWPNQDKCRVSLGGRAYFDVDDLRFGLEVDPGYLGRVALTVTWVEGKRKRSGCLATGINPALETAIARAYLDEILTNMTNDAHLSVAKNNIPS